jgi:serine/threonine-protein phosphatase PGAM5
MKQLDPKIGLLRTKYKNIFMIFRALQFPTEGWLRMSIGNCGITWLTIKPNGRVSLRSMGDTGHLHPHLITRN